MRFAFLKTPLAKASEGRKMAGRIALNEAQPPCPSFSRLLAAFLERGKTWAKLGRSFKNLLPSSFGQNQSTNKASERAGKAWKNRQMTLWPKLHEA